jgi:hypothetical protein
MRADCPECGTRMGLHVCIKPQCEACGHKPEPKEGEGNVFVPGPDWEVKRAKPRRGKGR